MSDETIRAMAETHWELAKGHMRAMVVAEGNLKPGFEERKERHDFIESMMVVAEGNLKSGFEAWKERHDFIERMIKEVEDNT